jgi:hypothetical protein
MNCRIWILISKLSNNPLIYAPEGELLFHMISLLGRFYCDSLSKETNKGKLERSLQGYHNDAVPWGIRTN